MNNNLEELITALYDMIQDAKSVPLSSDKCIIERDKALDMLDDLNARAQAEQLVEQEVIYQQTLQKCQEMAKQNMAECEERTRKTEETMAQIKAASFGYVDNSLRQTEETILKALTEVRDTRAKFQNITAPQAAAASYDQEL